LDENQAPIWLLEIKRKMSAAARWSIDLARCPLLADFVAEIGDQNSEAADAIF
jgi:hypothetical protein